MGIVKSILGATVGKFFGDRCYWAVKLDTGTWQSELDVRVDSRFPGSMRSFDWTLDLVATDDVMRIKELWLFCPPNRLSPLGNTAMLPIIEPGTAFQFKCATVDTFGIQQGRILESQVIGRVDDKVSGACTCFIWDAQLRVMSQPFQTSVYDFASWREGIAPPGRLQFDVLGLRL